MFENKEKTPISSLGEFGLIKHLSESFIIQHASTVKGIGDDAAVLNHKSATAVTTDLLLEGIHFNLMYTPLKHLGYKAVAVNLSDLCAMMATPEQITVSIGISAKLMLEDIDLLYEGIRLACDHYGVDLVGGDTSSSLTGLVISVTAIGRVESEAVLRSNAGNGDLICVSGNLGAAYLGLQILERERRIFEENTNIQPDLEGYDYILERQLKPEARTDIVKILSDKDVCPTAMIDVSDGLASDLLHICDQSQCGCRIYEEKIPIDPVVVSGAEEMNISPLVCALNGGEDYELLFSVKQKDYDQVRAMKDVHIIGHITEASASSRLVTTGSAEIELSSQGWDAFRGNQAGKE